MERDEWKQRYLDLVEEGKLKEHEHEIQVALIGVWRDLKGGCPHYHNSTEGVARCDANEMRPCIFETDHKPCALFGKIIAEWEVEYEIADKADALRGS